MKVNEFDFLKSHVKKMDASDEKAAAKKSFFIFFKSYSAVSEI